ncbi:MAG: ArsR family transcriptional regulator [Boseongicola sp. SB0662_bin_57]|nr:ArsR family transcriptional regulator [Boseongicola sp. SB0662_bin_57]MYF45473.1 ArsR family transcriptional regulator [Paracoccaceae bacterium]
MARISMNELRKMGVSQEDIDMARATQAAQRRTGSPVQSVAVLVGAVEHRRRKGSGRDGPADFTARALRRRGTYDQAALLLDQQALAERSPERAVRAREAAGIAKELSSAVQLEFDFFGGGNVSIAFQYQDAVTERLFETAPTTAAAKEALSILWTICRHLGWQTYTCDKTASQLCEITRTDKARMARALNLLEDVGAIRRVKRGRVKLITVTPEGAFRGDVNQHGKAVERYKLDVIDGGRSDG